MQSLLSTLSSPGEMTSDQWLLLAIAFFVLLGIGFFTFRLYKILNEMGKSTYKPNIGRDRLRKQNISRENDSDR